VSQPRVWLPAAFGDSHACIVFKYLDEGRWNLSHDEWALVFEAFDLLGKALADTPNNFQRFKVLYESQVEAHFADRYIVDLLALNDVEAEWIPGCPQSVWSHIEAARLFYSNTKPGKPVCGSNS